jgi:hypothetical protein
MNKIIEKILQNQEISEQNVNSIISEQTYGQPWSGEE